MKSVLVRVVQVSFITVGLCSAGYLAQTGAVASESEGNKPIVQEKSDDPNALVLKYQEFLRDEAKLHREYTQQYYEKILFVVGGLGTLIGLVLGWLNWNSRKEIRDQMNARFDESFRRLLDAKVAELDGLIEDNRKKAGSQISDIERLLLEITAKASPNDKKSAADRDAVTLSRLQDKKILWVDDYPANNAFPRKMLEEAGVSFLLATSTEQAIGLVQDSVFDLILSDMGRGDNDRAGLELLRELRELNVETPVIIYASPTAIQAFRNESLELGAADAVTGVSNLLNTVQACL